MAQWLCSVIRICICERFWSRVSGQSSSDGCQIALCSSMVNVYNYINTHQIHWPKMVNKWILNLQCTTKFWYVQSGNRVKKHILLFKGDQENRYELGTNGMIRYNRQISFTFFSWKSFFYLFILCFQSICGLLNSVGQPLVCVSVARWPTVDWSTGYQQPNMGAIVHSCKTLINNSLAKEKVFLLFGWMICVK